MSIPDSPIPFKMTSEQHSWICKTIAEMDRTKSEVIRACIIHSLDSLLHNPSLIKFLNNQESVELKDPQQINFKIQDRAMREWFDEGVSAVDCSKSEVIRACILLALPVLSAQPDMIHSIRYRGRSL